MWYGLISAWQGPPAGHSPPSTVFLVLNSVSPNPAWAGLNENLHQGSDTDLSRVILPVGERLGARDDLHGVVGHAPHPGQGGEQTEVVECGRSRLHEDLPPGQLRLELRQPGNLQLPHLQQSAAQ